MGYTLEQFAAACREHLEADPGPGGRERVRALLEEALKDEGFLRGCLGPGVSERTVLYEDPSLGFCVLAHVYAGAKESQPHDHGPSWAIYGQARGETVMSDWAVIERPTGDRPGQVRLVRTYTLKPGMAHAYHEGDVHSPRRAGSTALIRIEGTNMDRVRRLSYQAVPA